MCTALLILLGTVATSSTAEAGTSEQEFLSYFVRANQLPPGWKILEAASSDGRTAGTDCWVGSEDLSNASETTGVLETMNACNTSAVARHYFDYYASEHFTGGKKLSHPSLGDASAEYTSPPHSLPNEQVDYLFVLKKTVFIIFSGYESNVNIQNFLAGKTLQNI
jgi:hypothetical protein